MGCKQPTKRTKPITRILTGILICSFLITGCKSSTKTVKLGRVYISSEPDVEADIFINDQKQSAKTNTYFNLKPGSYNVRLVKESDQPDDPKVGEAKVQVKPGKVRRVTVTLSKMRIIPAAASTDKLHPITPGQKMILDFYSTLTKKDPREAYSYLNYQGKREQGTYWRWSKKYQTVSSVEVVGLELESVEASTSVEINKVVLRTVSTTSIREPIPREDLSTVTITSVDQIGVTGLPRISSIVEDKDGPPDP